MLEKLIQAAIITFLLHLIVGLNPATSISVRQQAPSASKINTPIAKLLANLNR
ncbi:MAG: hypothetical protein AAF378_01550 [Cyanobacteria bacterium P01_A01_bin.84]